jgi:cystathionine beta-lyase/cystathionine gamma-synthase
MDEQPPHRRATRLAHIGRNPAAHNGLVNPPIAKGATFLYPDLAAYRVPRDKQEYRYWRLGNPNARDFEGAMAELEAPNLEGAGATVAPSGVAACALPLLTHMRAGYQGLSSCSRISTMACASWPVTAGAASMASTHAGASARDTQSPVFA